MNLEHYPRSRAPQIELRPVPIPEQNGGSIDSQGSRQIPSLSRANLDSHPPEDSRCLGTASWLDLTHSVVNHFPWATLCSCIWGIDPLDFRWGEMLMEGHTRPHGASWPLG